MGDKWIKFVDEKKLHEANGKVEYINPQDGLFALVRGRDGKLRKSMLPPAHSGYIETSKTVAKFYRSIPLRFKKELFQTGKTQTVEEVFAQRKSEQKSNARKNAVLWTPKIENSLWRIRNKHKRLGGDGWEHNALAEAKTKFPSMKLTLHSFRRHSKPPKQ